MSFWKSQVNNNLLFSSLVKHLTPRQWKQRLSVTNSHMSDIQPHNQPFPSLTHIVMLPLLTLCPNRNYTRICPVTNRCVGDDSRFQTYYHEAFRLRLCLQRNHPCGLFSSYMIPVCIYFHFPCELCCGGDEQAEKICLLAKCIHSSRGRWI